MIVRKFRVEEWKETGTVGWLPLWMKGEDIDPAYGFGVAHDVLEHMCDKIGGATGEFYAFGAVIFNRLDGGWLWANSLYRLSECEFLSSLVVEILGNMEDPYKSNQRLADPGKWKKLEDYDHWNDVIDEAVEQAVAYQQKEMAGRVVDEGNFEDEWNAVYDMEASVVAYRIKGWITKGFRAAVRYYSKYRLDSCEVAYLFQQVIDELGKLDEYLSFEYIGAEMSMHINLRECSVECRMTKTNYDY